MTLYSAHESVKSLTHKLSDMLGNSTPLGRCVKPVIIFGQANGWGAHHIMGCGERGLTLAGSISLSSLARRKVAKEDMGLEVTQTPTTAEYSQGYSAEKRDQYSPAIEHT